MQVFPYFMNENFSQGSGFSSNYKPSIMSINDVAYICWIGEREDWPTGIYPNVPTQKQVVFTSTATMGRFWNFGNEINSVNIKKSDYRYTIGWGRSNDLNFQYTDSRDLSTIRQLNITGKDVQISNGKFNHDMYALVYNSKTLPHTINTKQIYPLFLPEEIVATSKSREGAVSEGDAQFYYSIGDISVDGNEIEFEGIPDTADINTIQDANWYLTSLPFYLDDNSEFTYTVKYGITDSSAVESALDNDEYVNFRVELLDADTQEILGVFDHITFTRENFAQYDNVSYQVNTSGIGNRTVRLRLVMSNNIDPYYSISDKISEESSTLTKKQFKQISYKGNLEVKEYVLYQNYPNPFNPTTKIKYSIPSNVKSEMPKVKLMVYDLLGREIATLVNEQKQAGEYEVEFDASKYGLSSGVYFYQLNSGNYTATKKLIYLR